MRLLNLKVQKYIIFDIYLHRIGHFAHYLKNNVVCIAVYKCKQKEKTSLQLTVVESFGGKTVLYIPLLKDIIDYSRIYARTSMYSCDALFFVAWTELKIRKSESIICDDKSVHGVWSNSVQ